MERYPTSYGQHSKPVYRGITSRGFRRGLDQKTPKNSAQSIRRGATCTATCHRAVCEKQPLLHGTSPMSALGHKRTFAAQQSMSALPSKADIRSAQACVRFVPRADIRVRHPLEDMSGGQRLCAAAGAICRRRSTVNSKAISARYCSMAIDFEQGRRLALSLRRHPFFGCSTSVKRFPCAAAEPARPPPAPRSTHAAPTARTAPTSGPATYTQ